MSTSLVTLMAVYIGFLFLFSGGSQKNITDAKSKLWLLVWGLVWVLGSWLVLSTIINFFTIIGKAGPFPLPWNQISCEVSQSQNKTNLGPTVPSPNNVSSRQNQGLPNGEIATDNNIDFIQQKDTVKVVATNLANGQTLTTLAQESGTGIGLVRKDYPNVFVMGGDLSIQDAEKLKNSLDAAASMLPADYNIKDKIIFVPTDQKLNKDLTGVASSGFVGKENNLHGFVSKNNVIVLSDIANKEKGYNTEKEMTYTLIHEVAHVRAEEIFGAFSGDSEWGGLHMGEKHIVDKNGFIIRTEESPTGFVSEYAKTNAHEDLAETITVATLALNGKSKAYTGDLTTDTVLQEKYEYLKKNGLIKDMPPR